MSEAAWLPRHCLDLGHPHEPEVEDVAWCLDFMRGDLGSSSSCVILMKPLPFQSSSSVDSKGTEHGENTQWLANNSKDPSSSTNTPVKIWV